VKGGNMQVGDLVRVMDGSCRTHSLINKRGIIVYRFTVSDLGIAAESYRHGYVLFRVAICDTKGTITELWSSDLKKI